jgi:hypothetical protein
LGQRDGGGARAPDDEPAGLDAGHDARALNALGLVCGGVGGLKDALDGLPRGGVADARLTCRLADDVGLEGLIQRA